jgi:hypothetical protein
MKSRKLRSLFFFIESHISYIQLFYISFAVESGTYFTDVYAATEQFLLTACVCYSNSRL